MYASCGANTVSEREIERTVHFVVVAPVVGGGGTRDTRGLVRVLCR